jgi:hypothetical protein
MLQSLEQPVRSVSATLEPRPASTTQVTLPSIVINPRLVIEHAVTLVFGVESDTFYDPHRGKAQSALARQAAMYLAHVGFSLSLTQVGLLFDRDRTTVAHACALIEDRRENSDFDRALELLERAVRAMQCPTFSLPPAVKQSTPK